MLAFGLVVLVAVAFSRVRENGFLYYDDDQYVWRNRNVLGGLTWSSVRWAFTTKHAANWHPLTWLSHILDVQIFGLEPAAHHLVNVAWHAANALLVLLVLQAATGSTWRSALVAGLFAVHPLHVESVAWVAERKDLVSTFFWLTATLAWMQYVRAPSAGRYLAAAAFFVAGLLAKPMVVTWPASLLIMDAWPLDRLQPGLRLRAWLPLIREKVPLLVLSTASGLVTFFAQSGGGAVQPMDALPVPIRLGNALLSVATYLRKAAAPFDVAHPYVHPGLTAQGLSWVAVLVSAVALGALAAVSIVQRRRRPWLLFGLAWFIITLLPVIGIVQVGVQGMADRYTYVPLLGPFVSVAWEAGELVRGARSRLAVALGVAAVLAACTVATRELVTTWRDDISLSRHAIEVTGEANWLAWRNLGVALYSAQRPDLAWEPINAWWRLRPNDPLAWLFLGIGHSWAGRANESAACIDKALALRPDDPGYWHNAGLAAARLGQMDRVRTAERRLRTLQPALANDLLRRTRARLGP